MSQESENVQVLIGKLHEYMTKNGLKKTHQRDLVAKSIFVNPNNHYSIEDILEICRKEDKSLSYATVYRTLMMLSEAGLVTQRQFGKGQSLFESALGDHHDHLICDSCGLIVEFENEKIEDLQEKEAKKHNFKLTSHKMELYGICQDCQNSSSI